jgi:opine dehydrogenase
MGQNTIAILGRGNGAHTMAAHMALVGEDVNLVEHPKFKSPFPHTLESESVELTGIGPTGRAKLNLATTDFARGLQGARWIHVAGSGTARFSLGWRLGLSARGCALHRISPDSWN